MGLSDTRCDQGWLKWVGLGNLVQVLLRPGIDLIGGQADTEIRPCPEAASILAASFRCADG